MSEKKSSGAAAAVDPLSFESRIREADAWFDKTFGELESQTVPGAASGIKAVKAETEERDEDLVVPEREAGSSDAAPAGKVGHPASRGRPFLPAPVTFLDGLASQKAREIKMEEKKRGGAHSRNPSFDLKKLKGKSKDSLAMAANAAGVSKDILHYAVNTLPKLTAAEEEDKRTVFWKIMGDYFRRVDKTDLGTIKSLLRRPETDSAFKVPPMGKKYRVQWQDEERIKMQLERAGTSDRSGASVFSGSHGAARSGSPAVKSRSKAGPGQPRKQGALVSPLTQGSLLPGGKKPALITSTLSPKPPGTSSEAISELCDVCFGGESQEGNVIVFCDSCNVAVHQACYGIPVVPEGQWLCNKCKEMKAKGLTAKQAPSCVLCPVRQGAMKPANPRTCITATGEPSKKQEFVHLFCSQWIPETYIKAEDTNKMEPVQNLKGISKERFKLNCVICKQRLGACIQCSHGMCATAFHPLCARAAGLLMEVVGYEGSDDVDLKAYCQKHSKRPVKRALDVAQTPKAKQQQQQQPEQPPSKSSAQAATPKRSSSRTEASELQAKVQREKGLGATRPVDLLAELDPKELGALLRQMLTIFGVKMADLSRQVEIDSNKITSFLNKKSNLQPDQTQRLLAWVRKFSGNLLSGFDGAGSKTRDMNDSARALPSPKKEEKEKPKEEAKANCPSSGNMLKGELPKCFRNELGEYMHMYTKLLLRSRVEGGPPASPGDRKNQRNASKELSYALACSPESETMGELFMMQHELSRQMLVNRRNLKGLLTKVQAKLPEEAEVFGQRDRDLHKVDLFIEASKEAKRLLKRERRAEQQKQNLAAAEAAVAQSTRHSAGRSVDDFYKPRDEAEAAPMPNIYTKDSSGQDVIYDKYSIQKTDQDLLCAVCGQAHSEEPNQIVFCEMCDLAVHQKCYGISEIPEGDWLCWPCKEYEEACLKVGKTKSQIRKPRWQGGDFSAVDAIKCACCPVKRGAFKKTRQGEWVHVVCAMWNKIPIEEKNASDAIGSIKTALMGSQSLTCSICNQKQGAVVKCNYGHCQTFFHPLCARAAGFVMPLRNGVGTSAHVRAYCGRHGHLVQQHASPVKQAPVPISPMLVAHIQWLEASLTKMRQIRQELERLRLISDVLIKREKTKTSLLRSEQDYILKCLQRPKIAKDFEEKMQDPEYANKVLTQGQESSLYPMKRKGGWHQGYDKAKQGRHHLSQGHPVVERQRVMTVDQAKATNVNLPAGYLYVPLDYSSQPPTQPAAQPSAQAKKK